MKQLLKNNLKDKVVLVTGGTQGIGLSIALAFADLGANCILTYHWGSAEEGLVEEKFNKLGARKPLLINANVADKVDTTKLFKEISCLYQQVDVFISNVTVTSVITSTEQYSLKSLQKSMKYSTWPSIAYIQAIKSVFGNYPRYVVAVSTTGIDHYNFGYDYVAASKVAMEILLRYLRYRLRDKNININIIRTRAVRTWSMEKTFGQEFLEFASHFMHENHWMSEEEVANAAVALCSGFMDSMNGQTLIVDRGSSFFDNLMHFYTQRKKLNLNFA